jgi:predicted anti-sigma-YlaC factor YlaD
MSCQEVRETAATALLTGQGWGPEVDEHLVGCSDCLREVEQLRPVVALLALAPPTSTTESPSDLLLHRTLAHAAQERRRRRLVAGGAIAASLLIVITVIGWTISGDGSDVTATSSSPTIVRSTASDPESGVQGSAQLQPSVAGSDLVVAVSGVSSGTRCRLVMVDRDGERTVIDTWTADYGGEANISTQVPVPVSQVSDVQLVDASARDVLLHFDFT